MRLDARDRLFTIRDGLNDARLVNREIVIVVPNIVNTDHDVETNSGRDISDGDGSGQDVTFTIYRVIGNLRQVDQNLIAYGHVTPGVQVGDTYLTIHLRDKAVFEQAYRTEEAYAYVDGERWRVSSINIAGVGHEEESVVSVRKFSPRFHAPAY